MQTSNILVDSPSGRSLLYFLATFFAVMGLWLDKLFYDSRVVVLGDDMFHRAFELAALVVLATAVLHIRNISLMENCAENVDTFAFCLAILIGNILHWVRYMDVYFFGVGQPVLKNEATRAIRMSGVYVAMVLVATILAGIEYFGNASADSKEDGHVSEVEAPGEAYAENPLEDHRWLAQSSPYESTGNIHQSYDLPMYFLLVGPVNQNCNHGEEYFLLIKCSFLFPDFEGWLYASVASICSGYHLLFSFGGNA